MVDSMKWYFVYEMFSNDRSMLVCFKFLIIFFSCSFFWFRKMLDTYSLNTFPYLHYFCSSRLGEQTTRPLMLFPINFLLNTCKRVGIITETDPHFNKILSKYLIQQRMGFPTKFPRYFLHRSTFVAHSIFLLLP